MGKSSHERGLPSKGGEHRVSARAAIRQQIQAISVKPRSKVRLVREGAEAGEKQEDKRLWAFAGSGINRGPGVSDISERPNAVDELRPWCPTRSPGLPREGIT